MGYYHPNHPQYSILQKKMLPVIRTLASLKFLFFGLVIGGFITMLGWRDISRAKASANWPNVQGEITESKVDIRIMDVPSNQHHSRPNRSNESLPAHFATIRYEYTVDGTVFKGGRVAFGDHGSSNPAHADEIVNKYPIGKSVTVYYRPDNPQESLLEPGLKRQSWLIFSVGISFIFVGCSGALIANRMKVGRFRNTRRL